MNPEPVRYICPDSDLELHVIGDFVAVAWNLRRSEVVERSADGLTEQRVTRLGRDPLQRPYIVFESVRVYQGRAYCREHSTVEGGISPADAIAVRAELLAAVQYLERLTGDPHAPTSQ